MIVSKPMILFSRSLEWHELSMGGSPQRDVDELEMAIGGLTVVHRGCGLGCREESSKQIL